MDMRFREINPAPIKPQVLLNKQETDISDDDGFSD
jgi:hypothetical protein